MKKKSWLIGILIVGLLTVSFLWSGKNNDVTTIAKSSNEIQAIADKDYSQTTKLEQEKENTAKKSTNQEKADKNLSSQEAMAGTNVPSDSLSKTDKESGKPETTAKGALPNADKKAKAGEAKSSTLIGEEKKDKYLTDPIPKGKPKPVEWQSLNVNKDKTLTCTLSVNCKTILDNLDNFNKDKLEVLPEDGVIYKAREVCFHEGESVFDVLLSEMKKNKIHMEFEMTPIYNSNYIEGINNLYEFDCGELSGWMYKVNGWFPNYGCSRYSLKDGDVVEWIYTCDLGRDIGEGMSAGGKD